MYRTVASILFLLSFAAITGAQNFGVNWVVPPVFNVKDFDVSPVKDPSRFVVKEKNLFGVYNLKGEVILPIEYSNVQLFTCGWMVAKKEIKAILYNAGVQDIGLPYDRFIAFNNGTAVVYKNKLCGLINQTGEEIVPIRYEKYRNENNRMAFTLGTDEVFYNVPSEHIPVNVQRVNDAKARALIAGFYVVKKDINKTGLLNLKRDTVVPPLYQFGHVHPSGYITVSFDGKTWGVIDTKHKTLYPITAAKMGTWTKSGLLPIKKDQQWGLVRFPKGEIVFPFGEYERIEVYDPTKDVFRVVKNGLEGLTDIKRNIILPCEYTYISQSDHTTHAIETKAHKQGFWYPPTNYIGKPVYKRILNLNDSLVIVHADTVSGVINAANGQVIIPFGNYEINKVGNFFVSQMRGDIFTNTSYKNRVHGMYDRTGKLIHPYDSTNIMVVLEDNTFWVIPHNKSARTQCELRNAEGKTLKYYTKNLDFIKIGYFPLNTIDASGLLSAQKLVYTTNDGTETYYQKIVKDDENLYRVKYENYWGALDRTGKVVIEPVFEEMEKSENGYIKVKYLGKWGVIQNPNFDYFEQFDKKIL